ncbi:MAG: transglycosylase domain-containing protein, partial [Acidobacteriota bacterium]
MDPADLPPHVVQAMLAVEDRRFYEHQGVDRLAILR